MANNETNYDINYEDQRFQDVKAAEEAALSEVDKAYDGVISNAAGVFQEQIDKSKEWATTQAELQKKQSDFAIEQLEQQRDHAEADYKKEQSGAYTDWQKQSGNYGANAEAMAAQGLANSGYSESSQVKMWNTYQNRVATARESFERTKENYANAIKDAQLQNSSILAQIAIDAQREQMEITLQGFMYESQLILDKAAARREVSNTYYNRYQDVLTQINKENAMAEEVRQFDAELAYKKLLAEIEDEKAGGQLGGDAGGNGGNQIPELPYVVDGSLSGGANTSTQSEMPESKTVGVPKTDEGKYIVQYEDIGPVANNNVSVANANEGEKQKAVDLIATTSTATSATTRKNEPSTTKNAPALSHSTETASNASGLNKETNSSGIQIVKGSETPVKGSALGEYAVVTPYYAGDYNPDVKEFGAMANGYQPKGIKGYGTVKKTGDKIKFNTTTRSGEKVEVSQEIWETKDGTLWYWNGKGNSYVKLPKATA